MTWATPRKGNESVSAYFSFFEISEEMTDLDPEIYALDIVQAVVRVLLFEMRREFMLVFLEIEDIGILLTIEAKAERYLVLLDFRIHLQNLGSQLIVQKSHKDPLSFSFLSVNIFKF
jgi:hypothetical protein